MKFQVCILAAGIGTRMSPLTDKINKSLLPVNFKATISYIIEKFTKETEIIIAVGHQKSTIINYLECAHGDRNIKFVDVDNYDGPGSGPGYSLMQCKKYIDKPFIFFASDTLVTEEIPYPSENWMGVSAVEETSSYCTASIQENEIIALEDKTFNSNKYAFIGLAGIYDYKLFFDSLERNNELIAGEYQVSNGFSSLIQNKLYPKYFSWFDTGNMEGYMKANFTMSEGQLKYDFSKKDEFLYFVEEKVIKYFADENIAINRCKRALKLEGLCPKLNYMRDNFYSYNMIEGDVIYDVINNKVIDSLLCWLDINLWKDINIDEYKRKEFIKSCNSFYFDKTIDRLEQYYNKYSYEDQDSKINDIKVPSVRKMLELIDWEMITDGIPSNFHGDLQFDNILMSKNNDFLLLDWRQDFSGNVDFGDRFYDFAKLNGGMQVSYKLIKKDNFSYDVNQDGSVRISHNIPNELINARNNFLEFLKLKKIDTLKVEIITSLIYLNMSPMHNEPFDHFIFNFGKLNLFQSLKEKGIYK
tara:strand:+ start:3344 stop:4927 length:1584 start_codon:yes stop_codon:yes gene_type:complete